LKEGNEMGKRPDLDALNYLFENGNDFQITGKLYEEKAGAPLPKDKNYIIKKSALAKKAREKGFEIIKVEEKPVIEKTVYLKKEKR